jgi:septal ring factor EnvC (AmiA/AmiB activator)
METLDVFPSHGMSKEGNVVEEFKVVPTFQAFPALFIIFTALTLVACVGPRHEAPAAGLEAAEQAISSAEQTGAAEHAPLELRAARQKLAEANDAVQERDMRRAEMLAEEARLAAELAAVRADANKAREMNEELEQNIAALKDEIERGIRQ